MKKYFGLLVTILIVALALCACSKPADEQKPNIQVLTTPVNVQITQGGLISWDVVQNATGYVVSVNGTNHRVSINSYQATILTAPFTYSVKATAEGYTDSPKTADFTYAPYVDPQPPKPDLSGVVVAIGGGSEIKSGGTLSLTATVNGTDNTTVTWSVVQDENLVSIDETGKLTATTVSGDKIVEVVATSKANPEKTATKVITVLAKPILTQQMLDALNNDKMSFEGFVNISLYTIDAFFSELYSTYSTVIKTSMDGTNWYAEYEDGNTGVSNGLYFKNHDGLANQVGVSFMNDELFAPMLDDDDKPVSWQDGGLYNGLKGLKVEDFTFDETIWRYTYSGTGNDGKLNKKLVDRVLASANPYDFEPTGFSLIIEENEILGIYSKSYDDYKIIEGYRAIQELTVALNVGEVVQVPTINKYSHEDIHDDLQVAINNMQALESYTLDFKEITASYLTSGYTQSGFIENITADDCYYTPYAVAYDAYGKEVHNPKTGESYGFHKINDNLYNAYIENDDTDTKVRYTASRAYAANISAAKPTFAFAAEIFRTYFVDEEAGTTTYYVDELMSSVASTFYYGMGNDINLYGIFATKGQSAEIGEFTPYLVVKDGYIQEACFYYYLGSLYGVAEISYSEFNTTELPEDVNIQFEIRNVPSSWSELTIEVSEGDNGTMDDHSENALEYLKEFYSDDNIQETMPFFGIPLGDTYGFGLTTIHIPGGSNMAKNSIVFYYDVPLDVDYTIKTSLDAVEDYLLELGYVKNVHDEFYKDGIWVAVVDSSLDLMIYVWKQ